MNTLSASGRPLVCIGLCLLLALPAPLSAQQPADVLPKHKIEILSAAGKIRNRKKNVISSESVIRVTDANDIPIAGATVIFSIAQLSGGSAAFANGAVSTIVATNAAGVASTGAVSAAAASSFNIAVTASVAGQAVSATIPMNMAAIAAGGAAAGGAGGGAAAGGAAAGTTAGISGAVIGGVLAAAAVGAVVAAKVLGGGDDPITPPPPGNTLRIGGPGTPTVNFP